MGNMMQRLLMPTEAPDWYAGGRKPRDFPEAPEKSLLLLGHVRMSVPDVARSRRFYVEGLGGEPLLDPSQQLCVRAGAAQFCLPQTEDCQQLSQGWPGHMYIWVRDIRQTLAACQALTESLGCGDLVEEVHNIKAEDSIDAVVLRDPEGSNTFVVNQAPPSLAEKMLVKGMSNSANLLGLIDLAHLVPSGTANAVARFYRHFFDAAITPKPSGFAIHFSLGAGLRQTLTFMEDESHGPPRENASTSCEICIYLPSGEKFQAALEKCSAGGLIVDDTSSDQEFSIQGCFDPETKTRPVRIMHLVRHPQHPDRPQLASQVV